MVANLPESGLVVLLGAPGAGKSTFARLAFTPDAIQSTDHFRYRLSGAQGALDSTAEAERMVAEMTSHRLEHGLLTVVDSTGTSEGLLTRIIAEAGSTGAPVHFIHVDTALSACLRNNALRRAGKVPEDWVERCFALVAEKVGQIRSSDLSISTLSDHLPRQLTGRSAFLAMPVTENIGRHGFRPDKRTFYEEAHAALGLCGLVVKSAAVNEDYGSLVLEPAAYVPYDIDGILDADCLLVATTSTLSPDIYLEIGTAIGSGTPVGMIMPERGRKTGMLRGLCELGHVSLTELARDDDLPSALVETAGKVLGGWVRG